MRELEGQIPKIVRARLPVLIQGERGTGKRTLAEHLHAQAGIGRFFSLSCQVGRLVNMNDLERSVPSQGDTWFLQHVGHLSPESQYPLLAELQQHPSVWIISSILEAFKQRVEAKTFLPELCQKVSGYGINLSPLRDRPDDILKLFQIMLARLGYAGWNGRPLSAKLAEALQAYAWPGNLWELDNIAQLYMMAASDGEVIQELDRRAIRSRLQDQGGAAPSLKDRVREAVKGLEAEIILRTLEKHHWNRRRAAQSLQISYRALLYKMKNCGIRDNDGLQAAVEGE